MVVAMWGCSSSHDAVPDAPLDAPAHVLCSPISMLADDLQGPLGLWTPTSGAQVNQRLEIAAPASLSSLHYFDVREGSFTISLDANTATPTIALEIISQVAGNRAGFYRDGAMLELRRVTDGLEVPIASVSYDATMKYLRFRVTGDALAFEASPDGVTFTALATAPSDGLTFVKVAMTFDGAGYKAFVADANGGTPAGSACPIAELADDFSGTLDKWAASTTSGGGTISNADGVAHLALAATNTAQDLELISSTVYDIRSSALTLDVVQMIDVATTQTFEVVVKSSSSVAVFEQTAGMLTARTATPISTNTFDPVAMRWWRIKAGVTSISWEVSPDDNAWTQLAETMQINGLDQVEVSIVAAGKATSPSEAQIDNVGAL
ncbi:MAG: hypothetical protein ABI591_17475 [Kofleriaceae bacterium]